MIVSGTFIADNAIAANIDIGFIPDYVELISALGGTELIVRFYRVLADAEATGQYGIIDDGAGALAPCASAAYGIAAYDEGEDMRVLIEDPSTGKLKEKAVYGDYSASVNYSTATGSAARSATAIGTIVRPTVHNGYVYELITTASGTDTEPTWPTTPGETVDAGYHIWMCREENLVKGGGKGFTVGASISTDSEVWVFKAERHDRMGDMGDAADLDPVSFPKYSN